MGLISIGILNTRIPSHVTLLITSRKIFEISHQMTEIFFISISCIDLDEDLLHNLVFCIQLAGSKPAAPVTNSPLKILKIRYKRKQVSINITSLVLDNADLDVLVSDLNVLA